MSDRMTQTLALQWRSTRWALLPFVVAGFGLPLAATQSAEAAGATSPIDASNAMLLALQNWTPLFPLTAALLGVTAGLAAWSWDHRANHVYALSLPLPRWRYALLKFGAGALLLLVPVVAVLAGVLLGRATLDLPPELHAYPFSFALRFLLAALILYALTFALAAGTMRTAIWVISGFVAFLLFGTFAVTFAREAFGIPNLPTPIDLVHAALVRWPGPFHVFGGNWMPIDV